MDNTPDTPEMLIMKKTASVYDQLYSESLLIVTTDHMLVHLRALEATGLEPMDVDGGADPYLKVEMKGRSNTRQSAVLSGLNPAFSEDFTFDVLAYGTDVIHIELWDKDDKSADDMMGFLDIEVCRLPPGYVVDSIYPFTPAGDCEYPGQIHLMLQVASSSVPRFQPAPFTPLMLRLNIFEARDIAKMDTFGKTDAFCVVKIKGSTSAWETEVIPDSMKPVWNETHDFLLTNPELDVLSILMRDKDPGSCEDMALLELPVSTFGTPTSEETWYNMNPVEKVKKGGQIRISGQIFQAPQQQYAPNAPGLAGPGTFHVLTPEAQAAAAKKVKEKYEEYAKLKKELKKGLMTGFKKKRDKKKLFRTGVSALLKSLS